MSPIENLITSPQLKEIVDAVTSKTKSIFVFKSTYQAKISELESAISDLESRLSTSETTISELSARVLDLEKFHYPSAEESQPIPVEEEEEP